jgi:hypothetical protein
VTREAAHKTSRYAVLTAGRAPRALKHFRGVRSVAASPVKGRAPSLALACRWWRLEPELFVPDIAARVRDVTANTETDQARISVAMAIGGARSWSLRDISLRRFLEKSFRSQLRVVTLKTLETQR